MKLIGMTLRNFMRFRKASLKLTERGMVLVEGVNRDDESAISNGAGKSTLVDALVWCLYGVTTHEPSAEGDDVINEVIGKNCEVSVVFVIGEYQHYEVSRRRGWKKGKAAQLLLTTWDPRTASGAAGEMTRGTMRDTQDVITKLIGMGVTTFKQSCVFGQGRAYRFTRLTDSEKKGVLDEMLGSELYARAGEVATERASQMERDLDKATISLENTSSSLLDARDRLAKLRTKAALAARVAQEERGRMRAELTEIEARLKKLGEPADVAKLHAEQSRLRDASIKANKELRPVLDEVAKAQAEIERLKTERSKLFKLEGATCILCKQHVSEAHIHKQTETIDEAIRRSANCIEQQKDKSKELATLVDRLSRATEECRNAIIAATDQMHKRERIEDQIKALTKKAKATNSAPNWTELLKEAEQCRFALKAKRNAEHHAVRRYKRLLAQLRFWSAGFGTKGLRSLLLDSALPYLNAKLTNYSNALTAGNIAVEFRTQRPLKGGKLRDDFHVCVDNRNGATKYSMCSVGERAKVDIVVGLALQDMAASRSRVPVNVAFFDEVFDGLDERGIDRAVQVLSELKRESAFIITHNDGLKVFFQNRITVVKENGESRIEE